MTMTDPVADFLTRLRNANSAYHETVSLPYSKLKANIAEILKSEGYIASIKVEDAKVGKTLIIDLKFGPNRERSLAGIKRADGMLNPWNLTRPHTQLRESQSHQKRREHNVARHLAAHPRPNPRWNRRLHHIAQ